MFDHHEQLFTAFSFEAKHEAADSEADVTDDPLEVFVSTHEQKSLQSPD